MTLINDKVNKVPPLTRHEMIATPVTLDGQPARVTGRLLDFPLVQTLDGNQSVEFAWPTVERIIRQGGQFRS